MELRDYLNVIRARKWFIIYAVLIVTIIAAVVSLLQTPEYEGEAKVLITTDTGASLLGTTLSDLTSQPERGLQTQVQLMQLRPRAEEVIRQLGLKESPEELMGRVEVTGVGQTNVVSIVVTDKDPERAADIANALAESYVNDSQASKRKSIQAAISKVETELSQAQTQIIDLGKKISDKGKSDELSAELEIATSTYATLAEKLETLRVNEQLELGAGRVVSAAVANADPVSPKPLRDGALGSVVGLVFGLGMAFLFEYLDNTIKSTEEAEKIYGAPVLGHIPLEHFEESEKRRLTIINHPSSSAAEAYRAVRNALDFINFEHNIKTLLVSSSAPDEGKSTVSANLAAGLAQAGKQVVLLNCDFRRPTTDQFFAVHNVLGVSDVLTGQASLKSALQQVEGMSLYVLSAGKMPPNPSELLGSDKMADIIASLKEWADWIIVDTPPVLAVADAAAISRWGDGILMVSRGGVSTRDMAQTGREILEKAGARILGVVVWGLDDTRAGNGSYSRYYGGYYGSYYYANYAQSRSSARRSPSGDSRAKGTLAAATAEGTRSSSRADIRTARASRSVRVRSRSIAIVSFVVFLVVLLATVYFIDSSLDLGLIRGVLALLS